MIRTRFAPSPTGYLHIGGLRTALYAYAQAKSQSGQFILRIEDTDRNRHVEGATEKLINMLKIFGILWDEGPEVGGPHSPYVQSERTKTGIYKDHAMKLFSEGHAFYCFCDVKSKDQIKSEHARKVVELRDPCRNLTADQITEKINSGIQPAIRLLVPDNENLSYFDYVVGKEISWNSKDIDDVMLLKSDGYPTYHLGVVVDDSIMGITHITRAHEWMPSTPVHLLLYKYLGFPVPQIGHVSDILDPDGGKLSKRKGSVACEEFLAEGYLPEAILNFIMLLGWAPKDNREIFSLSEFVSSFNEGGLQRSNPVFNRVKLDWFNGQYIRQKSDEELAKLLKTDPRIIALVKDRLVKLSDFPALTEFLHTPPNIDLTLFANPTSSIQHLNSILDRLSSIVNWNKESIENGWTDKIKTDGFKVGDFFMSLRIAICGSKFTPPITDVISILGKDESLKRINSALNLLKNSPLS